MNNEGLRIALKIQDQLAALAEHHRQTRRRRHEIQNDDEITEGARRNQLAQLGTESIAKSRKIVETIEKLHANGAAWTQHVHATRPVEPSEQARVVRLLTNVGMTPYQVLSRGRELRHAEMVAALRSEMLTFGDRHGFRDTREFVAACDRVLAEISLGEEGEVNRGLVAFAEAETPVKPLAEYAAKVALGQENPRDVLRAAYATGKAGRDDA